MSKNIDNEIKNALSQDIKIPEGVFIKAELAFEQIRNSEEVKTTSNTSLKKQLIAAVAAVCFLTLIVFGDSALAKIRAMFIDRGIQKAIDNNYVQVLSENAIKNNGVAIKVDEIISDKTKMAISFTLNFDDASKLKNTNDIMLELIIKDDKGKTITEDGNGSSMIGGFSTKTDASQRDKGELKYYLEMFSTTGEIIDVKNLVINVNSIYLRKQNKDKNIGSIKGNWDFSLKLDDKFTNKEVVKFKAENKNDKVELVSAEMLPTGMFIKFIMNKPVDESIISKVTLEDEQGNIYRSASIGAMESTSDKRDLIYMTFEVTAFENKDKLKMLIKDIQGKDIELNLVKDKSSN